MFNAYPLYDGYINLLFYTHIHSKLIIAEEYSDDCCVRLSIRETLANAKPLIALMVAQAYLKAT